MTISTTIRKAGPFIGNGVTTAFPFAFKVFADSDVVVTTVVTATGVETERVLTTDYSVALNADQNANPGGVVNMVVAPPATQKLVVTSDVPMTQGVLVTNLGGFYPDVFNNALDRLTIFAQQLAEVLTRSLTVAVTANVNGNIPVLAGGLIRFNAAGDAFEALSINELAGLTANNTLIDDDFVANSAVRAVSKNAVVGAMNTEAAARAAADATNLSSANGNALVMALVFGG